MKQLRFSWDPVKAKINEQKHGVSFEEAQTIFYDDATMPTIPTTKIGLSSRAPSFVSWLSATAYRSDDAEIPLISARKATKSERKQYEELLP